MQGIYTHIPETNYVPREYSVAAMLLLLFMVLISFFFKKIDLLLWDIQMFTWISIKTVPDTSLHKTADSI